MTIEETKKVIKVMQAYVDGKKIEENGLECWFHNEDPSWNWDDCENMYRVAPNQEPKEKHYRPYTMEEFVEDMHKHDGFVRKAGSDNYGYSIRAVGSTGVLLQRYDYMNYGGLRQFVWSDDRTPCGKEVTE